MITRRQSMLSFAASGMVLRSPTVKAGRVGLGITSALPLHHPAYGLGLSEVVSAGQLAPAPELYAWHGLLLAGQITFPGAPLFTGIPFGMGAGELRAWLGSSDGRRIWDAAWNAAGFHAIPCGVLQTRYWNGMALPFGFGQVAELAMPEQQWRRLPSAAQRAIQAGCARGMSRTVAVVAACPALTPSASTALTNDMADWMRKQVPAGIRQAYALARRTGAV